MSTPTTLDHSQILSGPQSPQPQAAGAQPSKAVSAKLPFDIFDSADKQRCDNQMKSWLTEADAVHSQYWQEWNSIDSRLAGDIILPGFTKLYSQNLADRNDPRTREAAKHTKSFVSLNRARPNQEALLGDFLATPKKLEVEGRTPNDQNIAKAMRARIEYIEDSEMLPSKIYFPVMDNSFACGLHWIKGGFNPRKNRLRGKFEITEVNTRDMLIDAKTRGPFFGTMHYLIHRKQLSITEARKKFKRYKLFNGNSLAADTDYDRPYGKTEASNTEYATFYEVEWKETVNHWYSAVTGEAVEISEEQYDQALDDPQQEPFVFEGEEEDKYYIAFFHGVQGCFYLAENPLGMFTAIPLINIETNGRLYPQGDVLVYSELLDLVDTLMTAYLENVKNANKPRARVREDIYRKFQTQIDAAIAKGGAVPGLEEMFWPTGINAGLQGLLNMLFEQIQDSVSKHAASRGELPSKQIAKETVQALMAKDRQAQGRKDIMVSYTLTMLAKMLCKMIALYDSEPDFFQVTDKTPGKRGYIPINQRWTEVEYLSWLQTLAGIPMPKDQSQVPQFDQMLAQFREKFESENDVKEEEIDGFVIPGLPPGANTFKPEEVSSLIEAKGWPQELFWLVYQPQPVKMKMFVVNDLSRDPDLNIRYFIDSDEKNTPEYQANLALMLNAKGMKSRVDTLKALGQVNPEEMIENVDKENQTIQLAKQLASNPKAMEAVKMILSQPAAMAPAAANQGQ
jgi:hypothetical protein